MAEKVQKPTHCKNTLLASGYSRAGGDGQDGHQSNDGQLHVVGGGGGQDGQKN